MESDHLESRLRPAGFELRAKDAPGDSCNPAGTSSHGAPGLGPGVHFNGHTDIVALGEGWTKDPFGADIEGDRIYGRGSCDMKGGLDHRRRGLY